MNTRATRKRLERLGQRLEAVEAARSSEPASVRWLGELRWCLPVLEESPELAGVAARVRDSIARLEFYVGRVRSPTRSWPLVEEYCQHCLRQLAWADVPGSEECPMAFASDGYEEEMRRREQLDRSRYGPAAGETP
jgi:hypothetical protein